jgi:hypothetical protein
LWRIVALLLGLAISAALVVALNTFALEDPTFIDRVSVDNPTGYDIQVTVAGEHSGSMPLGVAVQHCVTTFRLVTDQGAVWRISFGAQGLDGGDVLVDRASLERDGWTYRIPDSVMTQLAQLGAPLPPLHRCSATQ